MSRILLADDSPHAQRMGERILRDEGHEVVTVTDGETAFARLPDVDPDILILDANLPVRSGYEISRFVKNSAFYGHAGVLLTGSLAEPVDEAEAQLSKADSTLQKPFTPAGLISLLKPLIERAASARELRPSGPPPPIPGQEPQFVSGPQPTDLAPESELEATETSAPAEPLLAPLGVHSTPENSPDGRQLPSLSEVSEEERVRAAVTIALDEVMPQLIEELTRQVLRALHSSK